MPGTGALATAWPASGRISQLRTREEDVDPLPAWLTFPEQQWQRITPAEAGIETVAYDRLLSQSQISPKGWGGTQPDNTQWGDCHAQWIPGADLGRSDVQDSIRLARQVHYAAIIGISTERGRLKLDEPISKTWTGRGQLSHGHEYLDQGHHTHLTWRQLINHQGGYSKADTTGVRYALHGVIPLGATTTKDSLYDNYAHGEPGRVTHDSSGRYWRLGQAPTALWDQDLKQSCRTSYFRMGHSCRSLGLAAGPGGSRHARLLPGVSGLWRIRRSALRNQRARGPRRAGVVCHLERGSARWPACRHAWPLERQQLVASESLLGTPVDIHVVAGDPRTMVSIAKINPVASRSGASGHLGQLRLCNELDHRPRSKKDEQSMKAIVTLLVVILTAFGDSVFAAEYTPVASTTAVVGPQPTLTLSLDGENWLLDTDPQNVGRAEQWFTPRRRRRNRPECRGSSKRRFRPITAWRGIGAILMRRPIRIRQGRCCCVSGRWTIWPRCGSTG